MRSVQTVLFSCEKKTPEAAAHRRTWFLSHNVIFVAQTVLFFGEQKNAGGRRAPKNRALCHKSVFPQTVFLFEKKNAGGRRAQKNRDFVTKS